MTDQTRNLNPTPEATVAMHLWGNEYAAGGGGSMDFWDKLSQARRERCERIVKEVSKAAEAHTRPDTAHNESQSEFKYTRVAHLTRSVGVFLKFIGRQDPENASDEYSDHLRAMALAVHNVEKHEKAKPQALETGLGPAPYDEFDYCPVTGGVCSHDPMDWCQDNGCAKQ